MENFVELVEYFIRLGMFDEVYEFFKILLEDMLNGELKWYVVKIVEYFVKIGDFEKVLGVVYFFDGEGFEWVVYRVFWVYFWEDESVERVKKVFEFYYFIFDFDNKVEILGWIVGVLGCKEFELVRIVFRFGIEWMRRIYKWIYCYDVFEWFYWKVEDLEDWEFVRRICEFFDEGGRCEFVVDVFDLKEGEFVFDCEEFIEIRKCMLEDLKNGDLLNDFIYVYKEYEREFLCFRGVNFYFYKFKVVKMEEGV